VLVFKPEAAPDRNMNSSHLNQLALIVDTRGYYTGEDEEIDIFSDKHS
jgi:hypothetical protein